MNKRQHNNQAGHAAIARKNKGLRAENLGTSILLDIS